jgi:NAD(P)-dependent dehydrogenase (short-subunit alcohol dehydrogenase family)
MASTTFTIPHRPLTWLITGCSSGLGLLLARLALSRGHRVIATSRNPSRTPDLVAEFDTHPSGSRWLKLDVDDVLAGDVITRLAKESPPIEIDVLVNNAGYSVHQIAESLTYDEYKRQMETLFFGPMRLVSAVVPGMRQRRFGIVVGISSGAGLEARESMAAYGAAKAALEGNSLSPTHIYFIFSQIC